MKICIPVDEDQGLASPVCAHFGSAPLFMMVDTDTGECRALGNRNQHHAHGQCQPLLALHGEAVDGVVVGGIGAGAIARLRAAGIEVYLAGHATVGETLEAFKAGALKPVAPDFVCGHHDRGHGPGPGQGHGQGHGCGHAGGHGRGQGRGPGRG
jgi:predicted Fe-Mo cluster-binding NifX family protein